MDKKVKLLLVLTLFLLYKFLASTQVAMRKVIN